MNSFAALLGSGDALPTAGFPRRGTFRPIERGPDLLQQESPDSDSFPKHPFSPSHWAFALPGGLLSVLSR